VVLFFFTFWRTRCGWRQQISNPATVKHPGDNKRTAQAPATARSSSQDQHRSLRKPVPDKTLSGLMLSLNLVLLPLAAYLGVRTVSRKLDTMKTGGQNRPPVLVQKVWV
jgi:hypothetical protein